MTEQPTTSSSGQAADMAGMWLVVREVETDDGLFGADFAALARDYALTCVDESCSEIEFSAAPVGLPVAYPATATFDGTQFSFEIAEPVTCLDPATGEYTGPELTTSSQRIELEVSARDDTGAVISLSGTEMSSESAPQTAAPECEPGEVSATSDMVMFRPDAVGRIEPPTGVVRGGQSLVSVEGDELGPNAPAPAEQGTFEYSLEPCRDATCDLIGRYRLATGELIDVPLVGDPESGYSGTVVRRGGCADDVTAELLLEDAYAVTVEMSLTTFDVEGGAVVSITTVDDGVPTPEAFAAHPDSCYADTKTYEFRGRVVGDPVDSFEGDPAPVTPVGP